MSIQNSDQEVIHVANDWLHTGHTVFLVTVVRTWGSSPRPVGSIAAVRDDGELVGSVSGGCVEKQLVESLIREQQISSTNDTSSSSSDNATNAAKKHVNKSNSESRSNSTVEHRVSTLHVNDEQARRFGLSCGGELELVFEPLTDPDALTQLATATSKRQTIRRSVNLDTGAVTLQAVELTANYKESEKRFDYSGQLISKIFGPDWRILIIGAGQLSRYTAEFALALDYEVLVCDPRPGFKEAWKVANVPVLDMSPDDAVIEYASDANSAVLALTHDPNLDDLALLEALPSSAFYVGALGSMRNYEKRKIRLLGLGLEPDAIERLIGPIGLDIGSRTSAEIAISIVAHLIKVRNRSPVPTSS